MSNLSLLEEVKEKQNSMNKKYFGIKSGNRLSYLAIVLLCFCIMNCSHVPQPCDPEFLGSQQMVMAAACRSKAEETCPGYAKMPEEQKLECPGVQECLEKIEKAEADCHGS